MSFGSSKNKSKSTQSTSGKSTTTVDDWSKGQYESQAKGILDATAAYNAKPFEKYTGEMVAGLSPEQQRARQLASENVGKYAGILGEAADATRAGLNTDLIDVSRYQNPYERSVADAAGAYYDEQLDSQINANKARATQSGAYGGSRHGVAEGELMRTSANDRAKMMADLKYKGYQNSQDMALKEAQNKYQGAGILGNIAAQGQQLGQNDVAMMEQLGATSQQIEQAKLDASRAEFDREAADRLQKLMIELESRRGILSATPFGQTTTSSGTGSSSGSSSSSSFGFAPSFSMFGGSLSFGGGKG